VLAEFARWRPLLVQGQQLERDRRQLVEQLPQRELALRDAEAAVVRANEQWSVGTLALQPVQQRLALAQANAGAWAQAPLAGKRQALEVLQAQHARAEGLCSAWARAALRVEQLAARGQAADEALARTVAERTAAAAEVAAAEAAVLRGRHQADGLRQRQALAAFSEQLAQGAPCPLCGSVTHPAPAHHDDGELAVATRALAAAERVLQKAHGRLAAGASDEAAAQRDRQRSDEERAAAASELAAAQRAFASEVGAAAELARARALVEAAARTLAEQLAACQRDELAASSALQELQQALTASRDAERVQQERQQQLGAAIALRDRAQHEQGRTASAIAAAAVRAQELAAALSPACDALPGGVDTIGRLPGDRVAALQALAEELATRRSVDATLQTAHAAHQQVATAAAGARQQRQRAHAELLRALAVDGLELASVEAAARLGADGIEQAARQLRELEDAVTQARAALQVIALERQRHEAHARPAMDVDEAKQAVQQLRTSAAGVEARVEEARARLLADALVRRQRDELAPRLEAARATQGVWLRLDELIGSSTGDSFAVFAQGLTLDLLLVEANRRLAELARRYRLQRNRGGELDFVVVDLDLGGSAPQPACRCRAARPSWCRWRWRWRWRRSPPRVRASRRCSSTRASARSTPRPSSRRSARSMRCRPPAARSGSSRTSTASPNASARRWWCSPKGPARAA
jgi:exonuclease SbcC